MSADILQFIPRQIPTDGGKARIKRRMDGSRIPPGDEMVVVQCHPDILDALDFRPMSAPDDLTMDHADSGIPCDVAYSAPESDPA